MHVDPMSLEGLDPLRRALEQLMGKIRERARRRQPLVEHRNAWILGRTLRLPKAMELPARKLQDRISTRAIRILGTPSG